MRETTRAVLESAGYRVVAAAGGEEAKPLLRRLAPPCLLLADLMMPDVSGWDLIQEVRSDARLHAIPIIIISGVGKMLSRTPGVAEILHKPVGADDLLA